jgi:hypothetical protein
MVNSRMKLAPLADCMIFSVMRMFNPSALAKAIDSLRNASALHTSESCTDIAYPVTQIWMAHKT